MPQDRLRSPRGSRGRRITLLTDFEFRVWDQYQLTADDFGVMRRSAINIQAENDSLADRPSVDVQAALERLVEVELVEAFEHQGRGYICQKDWQSFQKVEYPRLTTLPKPTDDVMARCDAGTQRLFKKHPGGFKKKKGKRAGAIPEQHPNYSGTNTGTDNGTAPEQAPANSESIWLKPLAVSSSSSSSNKPPNTNGSLTAIPDDETTERAAQFLERYPSIYAKVRNGANYQIKPPRDFQYALQIADGWKDDTRIDLMLEIFLRMSPKEALNIPGTPGQFLHMAPECDARLREHGR